MDKGKKEQDRLAKAELIFHLQEASRLLEGLISPVADRDTMLVELDELGAECKRIKIG